MDEHSLESAAFPRLDGSDKLTKLDWSRVIPEPGEGLRARVARRA